MYATPEYRMNFLYLIALTSSLGSLGWGYCIGVFNSVRSLLQNHVFPDSTNHDITLLASLLVVGASVGSYNGGKLVAHFGRRTTLLLCDAAAVIGALFCVIQSLPCITIGRTILGIVLGVNSTAVPLYIIELAPLKTKGRLASAPMVFLAFGVMLGLSMGVFVPSDAEAKTSEVWRVLLGIPIVFAVGRAAILILILKFETPFYSVLQGKTEEAREVLQMIYTGSVDQHLQKVIKDKEASTNTAGNLTLSDLVTPRYRKAFSVGLAVALGLQLTGFMPIFTFFNIFIAESANNDQSTLAFFSTLLGIISFLFTLITALIADKYGRRPLIIYGNIASLVVQVLFIFISVTSGLDNWILKYLLILWPLFYRLSVGTLGFVYISEVLPSTGISFVTFVNWACSFLLVQTFLTSVNWFGINGVMAFYAVCALLTTIYYQKYLIESKGRTKAELLELYSEEAKEVDDDVEMKKIPLIQK